MDFVKKVQLFNEISGTKEEYDTRKVGLYTALILEEVGELVESLGMKQTSLFEILDCYRKSFKTAVYDDDIEKIMENKQNRIDYLDACVDISVVSLGGGISIGADIEGACNAISDNNLEKFELVNGEYIVLRDSDGKVRKPLSYKSVTLESFIK